MTTIHTKYLGPSGTSGSRMKASMHIDGKTISITIPYCYEGHTEPDQHWRAAHALLAQKVRSNYFASQQWVGSFLKPGEYIFAFGPRSTTHRVRPAMPNPYQP